MVVFNGLLIAFLIIFAITALCKWLLTHLNIRHLQRHGHEIPEVFRGEIDRVTLAKITDYTIESSRFRSFENIFDDILILLILLSGFLPWLLNYPCNFPSNHAILCPSDLASCIPSASFSTSPFARPTPIARPTMIISPLRKKWSIVSSV